MAKTRRAKRANPASKSKAHSKKKLGPAKRPAKAKVLPAKKLKVAKQAAPPAGKADTANKALKPAQRLAAAMQNRKKAGEKNKTMFGRPQGRRGRRPKNLTDYTPEHQEDENYATESEYEGLEYDTGIRVKNAKDEGFNADRGEEFDEELNFDW